MGDDTRNVAWFDSWLVAESLLLYGWAIGHKPLIVGRILSIDFGTKRTGIAVSDPLRIIAGGLETVDTKGLELWLANYFAANDVSTVVVGKPTQMNGAPSESFKYIEPLVARLRRAYPDKEVVLHDERYTSVMAHRTMLE
ncbi:MAG: RuvX/YqgF family protein, partial [Alistipes sp.]